MNGSLSMGYPRTRTESPEQSTKKSSQMKLDQWQIPLFSLLIVCCGAAFFHYPIEHSADIAAWVQGIGSLLAIVAAVWIYAKQLGDKQVDDNLETVAFVQAMRDEISIIWDEYADIHSSLTRIPQGRYYNQIVPLRVDSLIVYSATPQRVGKIDDHELRRLVVYTYTGLRGHLNSLQQNSTLVSELNQLYITLGHSNSNNSHIQRQEETMRDLTEGLKKNSNDLKDLIDKFLEKTEAWLQHKL
ncbi:hypothetical protein [Burkholderia gladioli]|uniref:hypothetical protein n=1 Tax=Burkholderia gladioli TaxID=28095 RepID=UPI001ABA86EF|nr:hypothetical protein [Burkholderia gladioli]